MKHLNCQIWLSRVTFLYMVCFTTCMYLISKKLFFIGIMDNGLMYIDLHCFYLCIHVRISHTFIVLSQDNKKNRKNTWIFIHCTCIYIPAILWNFNKSGRTPPSIHAWHAFTIVILLQNQVGFCMSNNVIKIQKPQTNPSMWHVS